MKTLIILILSLALLFAAGLTRPSEQDFSQFLKSQAQSTQTTFIGQIGADIWASNYAKGCTFKNRLLWTEVQKDGKTVFTGAFGHWWGGEKSEKK